jgi:hypothetical protein
MFINCPFLQTFNSYESIKWDLATVVTKKLTKTRLHKPSCRLELIKSLTTSHLQLYEKCILLAKTPSELNPP